MIEIPIFLLLVGGGVLGGLIAILFLFKISEIRANRRLVFVNNILKAYILKTKENKIYLPECYFVQALDVKLQLHIENGGITLIVWRPDADH